MPSQSRVLYLVNPAGHGGTGLATWERFKAAWGDPIAHDDVVVTQRPGEAREIAASCSGYSILSAVGGDGTVGEVMSGILERPGDQPRVGIVPGGTGNDIARTAGILSLEDAVAALEQEQDRTFDVVRVEYHQDGHLERRYAFLQAIAGFSSVPMIRPWMKRLLGPTGAYYLATLIQTLVFRAPQMAIQWGDQEYSGRTLIVVAGNAEFGAGGSMRLSPGARPDDGELNVSIVPARSRIGMLKLFSMIASGAHVEAPGVLYFKATGIRVRSEPPALLDLDGDLLGTTPATFTLVPSAVRIVCQQPHTTR
jgi:YegS/Rv2252/BmrU family lipid kinase